MSCLPLISQSHSRSLARGESSVLGSLVLPWSLLCALCMAARRTAAVGGRWGWSRRGGFGMLMLWVPARGGCRGGAAASQRSMLMLLHNDRKVWATPSESGTGFSAFRGHRPRDAPQAPRCTALRGCAQVHRTAQCVSRKDLWCCSRRCVVLVGKICGVSGRGQRPRSVLVSSAVLLRPCPSCPGFVFCDLTVHPWEEGHWEKRFDEAAGPYFAKQREAINHATLRTCVHYFSKVREGPSRMLTAQEVEARCSCLGGGIGWEQRPAWYTSGGRGTRATLQQGV